MPFFRDIYRSYMIASVLSAVAVDAVSMIASSVSGRYAGSAIFAVIGLGSTGLGIFAILRGIVSMGAYTECVRLQGNHDVDRVCSVYTSALILMIVLWFSAGTLFLACINPITNLLCQRNEKIFSDLRFYCIVRIFAFLPEMIYEMLVVAKFRLTGEPRLVTIFTLIRLSISLVLIAVMIALKIHWVYVVVLPNAVSFIIVLAASWLLCFRKKRNVHCVGLRLQRFAEDSSFILKAGAPKGLNSLYFTIEGLVYNAMLLTTFGNDLFSYRGLAASYGPIMNAVMAMNMSAMPLIGVFLAEKNTRGARFVMHELLKWLIPITSVIVIGGIVFRVPLAEIMGARSASALQWAPYAVACYFLSIIPCLIYDVVFNIHIYNQRQKMISVFDTLKRFLITLPVNVIVCRTGSIRMMFLIPFLCPALSVAALFVAQLFIWNKNRQLSPFTLIDYEYETIGKSVLLTARNTKSDIGRLCEDVENFSRENAITGFQSYILHISFEEVLQLVGEQAYGGDESKQLCVYLYLTDDEVITTIRFEGKSFDPVEFIKNNKSFTKTKSEDTTWIRDLIIDTLIFKTCKKKIYDTTFGINNLTLIFDRHLVHKYIAAYKR